MTTIFAGITIVIGLFLFMLFSNVMLANNVEVFDEKSFDAKSIHKVTIETSSVDIQIKPHNSNKIHAEWGGKTTDKEWERYELTTHQKNGHLSLKLTQKNQLGFNFAFGGIHDINLQIKVPKKEYRSIEVNASSGDVELSDIDTNYIEVDVSSGNINLGELAISGNLNARASSGDINISNTEASHISTKTSSGDISLYKLDFDQLSAKSSSGRIEMNSQTLSGSVDASTSSGDVLMTFVESPDSLKIDFKSSSGDESIHLDELDYDTKTDHRVIAKKGDQQFTIKVRTSSGDFILN